MTRRGEGGAGQVAKGPAGRLVGAVAVGEYTVAIPTDSENSTQNEKKRQAII